MASIVIHYHHSLPLTTKFLTTATLLTLAKARDAGDERHLRHLRAPPLLHLKEGAVVLLLRNLDGGGAVRPGAVRSVPR